MRALAERIAPPQIAVKQLRTALAELNITVDLTRLEPQTYDIVECRLSDPAGRPVAESAGKGGGAQSLASALFEAWEHYWGFYALGKTEAVETKTLLIADILSQPALARDSVLHRLQQDYPDATVGCVAFKRLTISAGTMSRPPSSGGDLASAILWYPAFLKNPAIRQHRIPGDDREYAAYDRYATSNGTASGLSVEDALLHALLELIERDAHSFALIDWYGEPDPVAHRVEINELPEELQYLVASVGRLFGSAPLIVDISTDVRVPSYAAITPHSLFPQANTPGSGASLDPLYAIERALHELAQFTIVGQGVESVAQHRRRVSSLRRWPLLQRCAEHDPGPIAEAAERNGRAKIKGTGLLGRTVIAQLDEVVRRVEALGLAVFWRRWDPNTDVPVVCVVVPELDTFFLVRKGVAVLPSGRAFMRIERMLGAHRSEGTAP